MDGILLQKDGRGRIFVLDSVYGPAGREVWLGVRPEYDVTPLHSARLLAVLRLGTVDPGAVVVLSDCSIDGLPDFEVIALADRPRTEMVTTIRRAWRADLRRERIVPISARGIACWMAQPRYCAGADLSGADSAAIAGRCAALFVRKNWYTQAGGGYPDQVTFDRGEGWSSFDTLIKRRHAMLAMEPETSWCRGPSCGATFRYLGRDDCSARLVTMDRDFAGLRLQEEDVRPAPGVACGLRPPLAKIPPTLPDSDGSVSLSAERAVFVFPVIPDTSGGWPDFATTATNYEWQAIVAGPDSAWIVRAQIYRPTPAIPSSSFRDLVRRTVVGVFQVLGGGRFQNEVPGAVVRAEGSGGRVAIAVTDRATVSRLFQTRPALVRLRWCDPYGRCGDDRVAVDYRE